MVGRKSAPACENLGYDEHNFLYYGDRLNDVETSILSSLPQEGFRKLRARYRLECDQSRPAPRGRPRLRGQRVGRRASSPRHHRRWRHQGPAGGRRRHRGSGREGRHQATRRGHRRFRSRADHQEDRNPAGPREGTGGSDPARSGTPHSFLRRRSLPRLSRGGSS